MKTSRINLLAALAITTLALSSLVPLSVAAENKSALSKKELQVLIANAKTPTEHQKIAAYYRDQAQRLTASAKEHAEMAEVYAKNPVSAALESKHGVSFGQGASHCRRWAQLDEEQAKEAEALAALHNEIAKSAEKK
jgi:hypothetical protein